MFHLHSISDLHRLFKLGKSHHPLVTILDFSLVEEQLPQNSKITTDFYSVMFKTNPGNHLKYGRKPVDFNDGSLICIAPNQSIEIDLDPEAPDTKTGWGLFFHPDIIRSTSLNEKMKTYTFFSYEVSEALHLSDKEQATLWECIQKIQSEIRENIDIHSQYIIVSTIELLLNYCSRFYGRQLITRERTNKTILTHIERILTEYFSQNTLKEQGLPSVRLLAERVNLSPGYLSDLLKKETGRNAQEHIHFYLIDRAKHSLLHTDKSISEIAYELGFDYPQYFNKLFKQKTGKTPMEYRNLQ